MSDKEEAALQQLDARIKLLREECWHEVHENADAKPAYALLRVYSKMKMFCEFYEGLRPQLVMTGADLAEGDGSTIYAINEAIRQDGTCRICNCKAMVDADGWCEPCEQRNVDEAAGINYKAGEY